MSKDLVMSYIQDIANHLWEPRLYGKASIMVGAGFSKNAVSSNGATMPDWSELALDIYTQICPPPADEEELQKWKNTAINYTSGKNILRTAEQYAVVYGHSKLDRFIENKIADAQYQPSDLHTKLLELPWSDIFTTNYDTLLEKAALRIDRGAQCNYRFIRQCKEIPGSVQPRIIKLHGCINISGPYIITEEDYRTYPMQYAPFVNTVQQAMLETQLCMIGFSGDDPNFLGWLGWLRDNMNDYCPKLYLCGILDSMPEAEKKLFENKGIILVDLSRIIDSNNDNKFYGAYKKFFELLVEYKDKQKNEEKIGLLPDRYYFVDQNKDIDENELLLILKKDHHILSQYILFPLEENKTINNNIYVWLNYVLNKEEMDQAKRNELIYYLLYRLRKGLRPLYDQQAEKLKIIVHNLDFKKYPKLGVVIFFSLCSMYRIDGNVKQYEETMEEFIDHIKYLNEEDRYNLLIERSRYYLCCFDYSKGIELLEQIPDNISNLAILLKKTGILCQYGDKQKASDLLKRISSTFAQEKLLENATASYSGYINILWRYAGNFHDKREQFSDDGTYHNPFNIRHILNEYSSNILKEHYKQSEIDEKEKAFNPNTYTYHYTIISSQEDRLMQLSFEYINMLDQLCIPNFGDQHDSILHAVHAISKTSELSFWRISKMARIDDKKEYNKMFTRSVILKNAQEELHIIFDNIKQIIDLYLKTDNKYFIKYIIHFENALDLFSRLAILQSPNEYWDYIKKIAEFWHTNNSFDRYGVHAAIDRFRYYVGTKDLMNHASDFLGDKGNLVELYANVTIPSNAEYNKIAKKYIKGIIQELSSEDRKSRNIALIKIFCIHNIKCVSEYYDEIENAIWQFRDHNGLPLGDRFYPYSWECFSKNRKDEFTEGIKNFFLEIGWEHHVSDSGVTFKDAEVHRIRNYYLSLYYLSPLQNKYKHIVDLNSNEILHILDYCIKYMNIEQRALKDSYIDFGMNKEIKNDFIYIGMICSILGLQHIINNNYDSRVEKKLEEVNNYLERYAIERTSLEWMIEYYKSNDFDVKMSNMLIPGKNGLEKTLYLGLNEILYLEEQGKRNNNTANRILLDIITAMPYMNSEMLINIPNHLSQLLSRSMFYDDKNINIIINALNDSFAVAESIVEENLILDYYYNLATFIKEYKNQLKVRDIKTPEILADLVIKLMDINAPEIHNLLEDE